jgi:hypothetical protein
MKKIIFAIAFIFSMFFVSSIVSQTQWVRSYYMGNWNSILFTDLSTGYIVGDTGKVLKTVDGGLSWNQFILNNSINNIDVVFQIDTVKIVGNEINNLTSSVVYKLNMNWYSVPFEAKTMLVLNDSLFVAGNLHQNNNFWKNTRPTNLNNSNFNFRSSYKKDNIAFLAGDNGNGSNGKIYITTNYGSNWDYFYSNSTGTFNSISMLNDSIYVTTNENLVCLPKNTQYINLAKFVYSSYDSLFIIHPDNNVNNRISKGTQATDLMFLSLRTSCNLKKIIKHNNVLFVIGVDTIYRYGELVPVPVQNNQTVNKFELSQNYPNPFNPNTTISFILAYNQNVSIKVYDIDGKLIKTLVNKKLSKGNHSVVFDGSNLSSGIYFYQFKTDSLTETKKMILVK